MNLLSLFRKDPPQPPDNGMSAESRRKAFWLLRKYSSLTTRVKKLERQRRYFEELEKLGSRDDEQNGWFGGKHIKDALDELIQSEKALEKLHRGDRSCFYWGADGTFCYSNIEASYSDHILNHSMAGDQTLEFSLGVGDQDLQRYEPLKAALKNYFGLDIITTGSEPQQTDPPAQWMPHWLLNEQYFGIFNFPNPLPEVPIHEPLLRVNTGQVIPHFGIWEPNTPGGCMNYLLAGRLAPQIKLPGAERADTTWTLLWIDNRYQDGTIPAEEAHYYDPLPPLAERAPEQRYPRVPGGNSCDTPGWWKTPSGGGVRRQFAKGELLPRLHGDYGETIWQWDGEA